MKEYTDEDYEKMKHKDWKAKQNHGKDCKCGYCELKKSGKNVL